jgi:hypothetical protein
VERVLARKRLDVEVVFIRLSSTPRSTMAGHFSAMTTSRG